jgi:hypothetical protein
MAVLLYEIVPGVFGKVPKFEPSAFQMYSVPVGDPKTISL